MQAKYGYDGLKQRPKYDEIVNYLFNDQQLLRYPNRFAKQIREHPYMTQLDGDGFMEMQDQQEAITKQQLINQQIHNIVNNTYISEAQARATTGNAPDIQAPSPSQPPQPPPGGAPAHGAGRMPRAPANTKVPFSGSGPIPPAPPSRPAPSAPPSGGIGGAAASATAYEQPSPFPYPFTNPLLTTGGGNPPKPGGGGAQLKARKKLGITKMGRNEDVISTSGNNAPPPPPSGDVFMFNPGSYMPEDFTFAPEPTPIEVDSNNQNPYDDGNGGGRKVRKKGKIRRAIIAANPRPIVESEEFKQYAAFVQQQLREHQDALAMIAAQNIHKSNPSSSMTFIEQQAERAMGADQVAPAPETTRDRSRSEPRRATATTTNTEATRGRTRDVKPITGNQTAMIARLKHGEGGASSAVPRALHIGEQRLDTIDIGTPRKKPRPSTKPLDYDDETENDESSVKAKPSKKPRPSGKARAPSVITVNSSRAPSRSQSVQSNTGLIQSTSTTSTTVQPKPQNVATSSSKAKATSRSPSKSRSRSVVRFEEKSEQKPSKLSPSKHRMRLLQEVGYTKPDKKEYEKKPGKLSPSKHRASAMKK